MPVRRKRVCLLADDLKRVQFETSDGVEVLSRFDDMNLREDLIRGIYAYAQSQSGTGKTATISIAILQSIDIQLRDTQALCISPTRELAVQTKKVILGLGDYLNVHYHACIGGISFSEDLRKLDFDQHIVCGTPGHEADEMLNQGFKNQIYDIYRFLPPATQVILVSATIPHEVLEMTNKFMTDPIRILIKRFV
ncbi:hypothetical protein ACI65C_006649 [Semiaphis heraclei]